MEASRINKSFSSSVRPKIYGWGMSSGEVAEVSVVAVVVGSHILINLTSSAGLTWLSRTFLLVM